MGSHRKNCFRSLILTILTTLMVLSCFHTLRAQEEVSPTKSWEFTVAPYVLFPHMNGYVTVRGIESAVAVGPGDIFSDLNFGIIGIQYQMNKRWMLRSEGGIIGDRKSLLLSLNYRFLL